MSKDFLFQCRNRKCESRQFERDGDEIRCSKCGKVVDLQENVGFLDPSDSKLNEFIIKLGIDIGTEAATLGASALIGVLAPWTLTFTFTALGIVIKKSGEAISEKISDSFFNNDSYGKCISDIFEKELKTILKKGKATSSDYNSFYNYYLYCSNHYSKVISFLLDNDCNTDIFSEEAIKAIVSENFGYPGHAETVILKGILSVASELQFNFEQKVIDNKDTGLRWLVEKAISDQDQKLSRIIELLTSSSKDNSVYDDDTYEYIKNYKRHLFLDKKNNIALEKMYLEPQVENMDISAIEAISNWCGGDEKLLFVLGAAGVGKTSLVTKIISDIYGISGQDSLLEFDKTEIHSVILRDKVSDIMEKTKNDSYSALSVIRSIINIPDCNLDGHLIILDGFDELCVLANEFNGKIFVQKLIKDLEATDIKIMITSRPMNEIIDQFYYRVPIIKLIWTESQIIEWCDKFSKLTKYNEEKEWCDSFKANYSAILKSNPIDSRLEMFSVPIILYLACKSNTMIEKDDSIGKFYDRVFRAIAERKHSEYHRSSGVYEGAETERINKLINWQFTKELAYQMYLNDTLTLTNCDKYGIDRIDYAKRRTIAVLRERGESVSHIDTELYLAVSYFANGQSEGIEFAHKTVYEYFTALKLYEDYFACFNAEYFKEHDIDPAVEEVWNNIIEAFRYSHVSEDIFNYLNEMTLPVYTGSENESTGFDYANFEKCYIEGMKKRILSYMAVPKPLEEYKVNDDYINTQICLSFRNLTWFLTGHGFVNKDDLECCKDFRELISINYTDINCWGWNLSGINMDYAILIDAILINAKLDNAKLNCSDLGGVDLSDADLSDAELNNTNLRGSTLNNAIFNHAKLENADLIGVDLSDADLSDAELNNTSLIGSTLNNTIFNHAKLKYADLSSVKLTNVNLIGADLEWANLNCTDLVNNFRCIEANLIGADLRWANLTFVNLIGADLRNANLNSAKLFGAKLSETDFRGSYLGNANLTGADLSGADLSNTNLDEAILNNAKYCTDERCKTLFPEGFDPKFHGMIEVDIYGNPISEE